MKRKNWSFLVLSVTVAVMALLMSGCPKPTAEMNRAKAAIDEAKSEGAGEYASAELASAESLLKEGQDLMKKLRYKEAKQKFEQAYQMAQQAKEKAIAARPVIETGETVVVVPGGTTRTTTTTVATEPPVVTEHVVVKGECLWWIAEYEEIYNDPFQWPLIYWENQDLIDKTARKYGHTTREEDWIYPGQEFTIPRDVSMDQIKKARKKAGAPAPYTPPGE